MVSTDDGLQDCGSLQVNPHKLSRSSPYFRKHCPKSFTSGGRIKPRRTSLNRARLDLDRVAASIIVEGIPDYEQQLRDDEVNE